MTQPLLEKLCSVAAIATALDPIATAGTVSRILAIEMPTPWGDRHYNADPEGSLWERIMALREAYFARMRAAGGIERAVEAGYAPVQAIAPDPEWSQPEVCRVLLGVRPEGLFSEYEMREFALPAGSEDLIGLAQTYIEEPERLEDFDRFRVGHGGYREFFVCTHGHVDICCARFGVPLYRQARAAFPKVRAWRMNHFGGHRYAPTAWEFPSGYKWAYLDEEATQRVIDRDGDASDLVPNVRGWSGAPAQSQLLDRAGLQRFGWRWLTFRRRGEILEADTEAKQWRVRLRFESPKGESGAYEGTVIVARHIKEIGCGQHAGEHDYDIPEYALESLTQH